MGIYTITYVLTGFQSEKINDTTPKEWIITFNNIYYVAIPSSVKVIGPMNPIIEEEDEEKSFIITEDLIDKDYISKDHFNASSEDMKQLELYAKELSVDISEDDRWIVQGTWSSYMPESMNLTIYFQLALPIYDRANFPKFMKRIMTRQLTYKQQQLLDFKHQVEIFLKEDYNIEENGMYEYDVLKIPELREMITKDLNIHPDISERRKEIILAHENYKDTYEFLPGYSKDKLDNVHVDVKLGVLITCKPIEKIDLGPEILRWINENKIIVLVRIDRNIRGEIIDQ